MPLSRPVSALDAAIAESRAAGPEDAIARLVMAIPTEFDDLRLALRRWLSARPTPDALPPYEELALGSIGRFSREMAVLRRLPDQEPIILQAGDRFQALTGVGADATIDLLPSPYRGSIVEAMSTAWRTRMPSLSLCLTLTDGLVSTVEALALPLQCRWQGDYCLLIIRPRVNQLNLARLLINAANEGIMALGAVRREGAIRDFSIISLNDTAGRHFGAPADMLQTQLLSEVLAQAGLADMLERFLHAARQGVATSFEIEGLRDGKTRSLQVSVAAAGEILAVTLTDIGELKARETMFRALFDANPVPMFVTDQRRERFLRVNPAALSLYGYNETAFLALDPADLLATNEAMPAKSDTPAHRHITSAGAVLDVLEYTHETIIGHSAATLTTIVDVTERKRAEEYVTFLAHHDPLTGVANRTLFTRELTRMAAGDEPFAVVLLDLDDFKIVNDTNGHATGDALLVEVTAQLQRMLRRSDLVARLGGDEFALLLPGMSHMDDIAMLTQRLLTQIAAIRTVDTVEVSISASMGAALFPQHATETENLLKCADLALYCAKNQSKGLCCFFEPEMDSRIRAQRTIEMELRGADVEREFELHFQPIFTAEDETLQGFEALLRWNNPHRGRVSPDVFIPLAEETGVIHALGRWVIREACRQAARWPDHLWVAVNVSPLQFRRRELHGILSEALAEFGLRAARLQIEVTESVLLADTDSNLGTLNRIRELGIPIVLDDFGTGYSSMSYLRRFRFSRLKIDRSFIGEIGESAEALAIVRTIIGLARSLGMTTTAEGVETRRQFDLLKEEGCMAVQGYLLSRPVPAAETAAIIARYEKELLPAVKLPAA